MFSLAVRWRMRSDNPCRGIERNSETKRKRYLSAEELARLLAALRSGDHEVLMKALERHIVVRTPATP